MRRTLQGRKDARIPLVYFLTRLKRIISQSWNSVFFFLVLEKYDIGLLFQPLWSYAGHWLEWVVAQLAKRFFL
jgi:hypothetical protein